MTQPAPMLVRGRGAPAWLAGLIVARFGAADPRLVFVEETGSPMTGPLVIRPDMEKLHRALGVDLRKHGAVPADAWSGPKGQRIPFGTYGMPLDGVAFRHLWVRARAEGSTAPLEKFAAKSGREAAFIVEAGSYHDVLRRTGVAAGIGERQPREAALTVLTEPGDAGLEEAGVIRAGAAALDPGLTEAFLVHVVHKTMMALVRCLPANDDVSRTEYARLVAAIGPCLGDMEDLLTGGGQTGHRRALWRSSGQLVTADDDPFSEAEWTAALMQAEGVPRSYHRLADSISDERLREHVRRAEQEAKRG